MCGHIVANLMSMAAAGRKPEDILSIEIEYELTDDVDHRLSVVARLVQVALNRALCTEEVALDEVACQSDRKRL